MEYKTTGICCTQINVAVENGKVAQVHFLNGCDGNLKAVSQLVRGMPVEHTIELLKGIDCGKRGTSCPAQLAHALEQICQTVYPPLVEKQFEGIAKSD
ncbi:MAG: TIGR03905 family TSCPD domain-containing protein [Clostridiales bacterium]|nr:TIGR03905 family TSCPD domain-containing protein [Clostridiales bacterium]